MAEGNVRSSTSSVSSHMKTTTIHLGHTKRAVGDRAADDYVYQVRRGMHRCSHRILHERSVSILYLDFEDVLYGDSLDSHETGNLHVRDKGDGRSRRLSCKILGQGYTTLTLGSYLSHLFAVVIALSYLISIPTATIISAIESVILSPFADSYSHISPAHSPNLAIIVVEIMV